MTSVARQMLVVALLLATVIVLFVSAQLGQRRLEEARTRIEVGAQRRQALAAVRELVRQAESSQRGYILLGNPDYLTPFQAATAGIDPALVRLDSAFAGTNARARGDVAQLQQLSDTKFNEMKESIELFATRGRAAALELMRAGRGAETMTEIDEIAGKIDQLEVADALDASRRWQLSRWLGFATTSSALVASAALLLLLTRLTLRQLRSKERETELLVLRQGELERLVEQRTEELSELSTHLQSVAEQEKTALSRELHDELGGLLVAARMDLSWIEERLGGVVDAELRGYFRRVQDALQSGVDIKRRVIESLRPTLLDNLGLVPALRWQVSETCERAGLKYVERYPEEVMLAPQASITVFRIVQEGLANVLKHARARNVEVSLEVVPPWLLLRLQDDGVGIPLDRVSALRAHGLASMRQRARALGGQWEVQRPPAGGTRIEVRLPLERVLAEPLAQEEDEQPQDAQVRG
jgi:signal transduction histidine kinase